MPFCLSKPTNFKYLSSYTNDKSLLTHFTRFAVQTTTPHAASGVAHIGSKETDYVI